MRGAVSPATRAIPSIDAVTRPARAAGNTIRNVVAVCVAPSAYADVRKSSGTNLRTSSAVRATVGSIRMDKATAPEIALNPLLVTKTAYTKRPATIDGTPLIELTMTRTAPLSFPLISVM